LLLCNHETAKKNVRLEKNVMTMRDWILCIRTKYLPAAKFLSYINGDDEELTEELQGLDINGVEPPENGHSLQEVHLLLALLCCLSHSTDAI